MAILAEHAIRRGHQVSIIYSPDRADRSLIERLRSAGCTLCQSQMQRSVGLHDLKDGFVLRLAIRSLGKVDVVHSHSSKAGALARSVGRVKGAAQVYSPHGFYTMTGEAPFYVALVERLLAPLSDRIIAVSKFEADHGVSIGIPRGKISTIANGIEAYEPLSAVEARAKLGIAPDEFAVGFVGRLADQKDPVSAVAAIDRVRSDQPVSLTIIGDGDRRPEAERAASSASHRVNFTGGLQAAPFLSAFDCLLCTSRYEGMPLSFLEALNCGIPIVTYDVGGAQELVSQSGAGFVTIHDPVAAAEAIDRLMGLGAGERAALSGRCKSTAGHYSASRMGDETLSLYAELASAKN